MRFTGGVLDGQEHDVWEDTLRVSVKDGKWHKYPDQVVKEWQVYERRGEEMIYVETRKLQ